MDKINWIKSKIVKKLIELTMVLISQMILRIYSIISIHFKKKDHSTGGKLKLVSKKERINIKITLKVAILNKDLIVKLFTFFQRR